MNTYIKGRITKGEFVSELFKQRVESVGGTYEANECLVNSLNSITDREFKDAKLILTPNGYVVDKLPTIKPNGGGDATVTRNTTKTRVNSSGLIESMAANVLAPDYLNGVCPALNVEGQSTNVLSYSEEFDNASWDTGTLTITPNATTSPDGTVSAQTLGDTGTVNQNVFVTSGLRYTVSAFAKAGTILNLDLRLLTNVNGGFSKVDFDLTNKTFVTTNTVFNPKIVELANGWFKCSYTIEATATGTSVFRFVVSGGSLSVWGTEFKQETEASSYIPTPTTAQVTRSADNVTVPVPANVVEIIEKYDDGSTNVITTIPTTYALPNGRFEYILMR